MRRIPLMSSARARARLLAGLAVLAVSGISGADRARPSRADRAAAVPIVGPVQGTGWIAPDPGSGPYVPGLPRSGMMPGPMVPWAGPAPRDPMIVPMSAEIDPRIVVEKDWRVDPGIFPKPPSSFAPRDAIGMGAPRRGRMPFVPGLPPGTFIPRR
jgi:hypothetical protein